MERKGFLMKFSDLASGKESLILPALDELKTILAESAESDLKYTLDRLLKGLTGGKISKIGFSMGLTMLFKEFPVDIDGILKYFNSLDHSGISPFQQMIAQVLISICIQKAGKVPPKDLQLKVVEIFESKSALKEISAVALSSNQKSLKIQQTEQDVNTLLISYSKMSAESVLNQASRHKDLIFKGSFKVIPRLHHIWTKIISASVQLEKEEKVWDLFVEKTIEIDDKKRAKRIFLSFLILEELISQQGDIGKAVTSGFWNVWQDNILNKKLKDNQIAVKLKQEFLEKIEQYGDKGKLLRTLLDLVDSVKVLDFLKTCIEKILESSDDGLKKIVISEISKFKTGRKSNLAIGLLYFIAKSSESLQKISVKKLLNYCLSDDKSCEIAKTKLLVLANELNLHDKILTFFKPDLEIIKKILPVLEKSQKFVLKESEHAEGKRGPGDLCLISQSQLDLLLQVLKILAIEGIIYNNSEDFQEFYRVIKNLISGQTDSLDKLYYFLLSALTKPVGYIRLSVCKVFKSFVNEISDEFLDQVCRIVETGQFSIESAVEETEETELFVQDNSKTQEKAVKDSFLARTSELLEIVVKKSDNLDHRLKVYLSLVRAFRAASISKEKQHLASKFSSILQKVHKKELKLEERHSDLVNEIILLCLKTIKKNKDLARVLCLNISNLLRVLKKIHPEKSENLVFDMIAKFFEKHNSSFKLNYLVDILKNFEENDEILFKVLDFVKIGRSPVTQFNASEVFRGLTKSWKINNYKFIKRSIKILKSVESSEIKEKIKNSIEKNLLNSILCLKKYCEDKESLSEDIDSIRSLLSNKRFFNGLFIQITSTKPSN